MQFGSCLTLSANTPQAATALRSASAQTIFGGGLPTFGPQAAAAFDAEGGSGGAGQPAIFGRIMGWCERITYTGDNGVASRMIMARTAIEPRPSTLFVALGGHGQGWFPGTTTPPGLRSLMQRFVDEHDADVLLVSMPLQGDNAQPSPAPWHHDWLRLNPPVTGSSLRYFLDGVVAGINNAIWKRQTVWGQTGFQYENIVVAGLSGGGWKAVMLAALDPRVTHCYSMGGTLPLFCENGGRDFEQLLPDLNLDYPDLYMMGIDGGRRMMLLYSLYDSVWPGWHVEAAMKDVAKLDTSCFGDLNIFIDRASSVHDFTPPMIEAVMDDFSVCG